MGRTRSIDGVIVPFTSEEEAAADVKESAFAAEQADYLANRKYKDVRRAAYPDIGDQMDMQYHDLVNDTTTWQDAIQAVKDANPKP